MSADTPSRREKLQAFVRDHPADAFARYGLAMECVREGDAEAAIAEFRQLLATHPDYVAGYFHYGQLLAKLGREEEARQTLRTGIQAAERQGDAHAASEMTAALDSLV
jgi:tetratricopeptide (TPR) repeat protein